jgi:TP901 family phage tail tape measure protein
MTDVKTLATGLIKLEVDASDVQGSMTEAQAAIKEMTRQGDYEVRRLDNAWRIYQATTKSTAASTDMLAERKKYLTDKLAIVNQQVAALQTTYDKFGGKQGDVTAQTHKIALALDDARIKQAEYGRELKNLDATQLRVVAQEVRNVREEAQKTAKQLSDTANRTAIWGAALVAPIVAATKTAVEYGAEVNRVRQITGATAETISSLTYAADQNEASAEALTLGMRNLARNMAEAHAGGKAQKEMFKGLRVDIHDANGELKKVDEVLLEIANSFANNTNETEKSGQALDIFGRSGDSLIPMLNLGAAGIREFQREAERLGVTISGDTAQAMDDLDDSVGRVKTALKGASLTLAQDIVPAVADAVEGASGLIAKYREIPEPVRQFGTAAVGAAGATLILEAGALKAAAAVTSLKAMIVAGSITTAGWVGIIAGAVAIVAGLTYAETQRREALGELGRAQEDVTRATDDYNASLKRQAELQDAARQNQEDVSNMYEYRDAVNAAADALERKNRAQAEVDYALWKNDPTSDYAARKAMAEGRIASRQGSTGGGSGWGGGGGSGKVITELDRLDYRLRRAESQSRLYGDAAEYVAERQALMQQQLAIANEAVSKAEQVYSRAATTTGIYSEATMKAGQALDAWREKQDALTKSIEATNKAMDPVAKITETVERGGGSNKALMGLLRAGVSNYDEQVAVLSQASGFDLATAQGIFDSTLMDRFRASGGNIPASNSTNVTVYNNGHDLTGDDVVKAIGRAEVIR